MYVVICQSLPGLEECQHASSSYLEDLNLDSYAHDIWNDKKLKVLF